MSAWRAVVVAVAALALVVIVALASTRTQSDLRERAGAEVADTRALVAGHAAAMRQQAEALIAAAERASPAQHGHWIADGQLMLAYASSLEALAAKLADQERLLGGHSTWRTEPGIGLLRGAGATLREDGRATLAHADAMTEHAAAMERSTASGALAAQDIAALRDGATRMRESGLRVARLGDELERYGDDLARSMAMR